jgi:zinc transporter ZupT
MILKLVVLFFTPLLSGLLIYLVPKGKSAGYKLLLVFAGAYLFAITVIHILPELYQKSSEIEWIGLFVLAGFFLQQLLEYFTSGVEHGHLHTHHDHDHSHGHKHDHGHHHPHSTHQRTISALMLLSALCVHAFLEGGMLAKPVYGVAVYDLNAILLGIALHRAPAAFALMTVLVSQLRSKTKALPYLIGFSLAAPIGLIIATHLANEEVLSQTGLILLYALVSGNFLHISTTIVFESSPDHRFNAKKMAVAVVGALAAVAVEYIL